MNLYSCGAPATRHEKLSTDEAAALADLTARGIRRACQEGRLPAAKVGRSWRIDREDFEIWISDPDAHRPGVRAHSKST